jgi:hypothetical protein
MADSLVDGEECWLSNGIRGFIWAKISLNGHSEAHLKADHFGVFYKGTSVDPRACPGVTT